MKSDIFCYLCKELTPFLDGNAQASIAKMAESGGVLL